jgi:hypothetical protein
MRTAFALFQLVAFVAVICAGQPAEPVVSRDEIWVDAVRRGTMPLRERAHGSLNSAGENPSVAVSVAGERAARLHIGDTASVKLMTATFRGRIVALGEVQPGGLVAVEIAIAGELPAGAAVGTPAEVEIEYGRIEGAVFVGRSAGSRDNADGTLFRVDSDKRHATRVRVRYGLSGADVIEIREGLQPGDSVIISDIAAFSAHPRIRLE